MLQTTRKSRKQGHSPLPAAPQEEPLARHHWRIRQAHAPEPEIEYFGGRAWHFALPTEPPDVAVTVPLRPIVTRGHSQPPFDGSAKFAKLPTEPPVVQVTVPLRPRSSSHSPHTLVPPQQKQGGALRSALPESESFFIVQKRYSSFLDTNASLLPPPFVGRVTRLPGPKQIRLFADSIRFFYTGATENGGTQTDDNASLGNFRSSTEAERTGIVHTSLIRGLNVVFASRENGSSGTIGAISLSSGGLGRYTAQGSSTPGPETEISFGTTILLRDGSDGSKWVRVRRTISTPMSGYGTVQFFDQFNNVFGLEDADNTESGSGGDRYRAVMFSNQSSDVASSIKFFVKVLDGGAATTSVGQLGSSGAGTVTGATDAFCSWPVTGWARIEDSGASLQEIVYYTSRTDTALIVPSAGRGALGTSATAGSATDIAYPVPGIRIALEDASPLSGGAVQTIANESTSPTGRTWSTARTAATGLSSTNLDTGENTALWIHRELPAGTTASPEQHNSIGVSFVIDGTTYTETLYGMYRVADTDIEGYELHIGTGSEPDITAAPTETFTSFPNTTTATLSADTTSFFVLNFRNRYNLVSKSQETTVLTTDGSNDLQTNAPTAPVTLFCKAAISGTFDIQAVYYYDADGSSAADGWLIYSTFDGSTPDPSTDIPDTATMTKADGAALLNYSSPTQPGGATGKFIIRVRRSSDTIDSTNTDVCIATNDVLNPVVPEGGVFFEGVAESGVVAETLTSDKWFVMMSVPVFVKRGSMSTLESMNQYPATLGS